MTFHHDKFRPALLPALVICYLALSAGPVVAAESPAPAPQPTAATEPASAPEPAAEPEVSPPADVQAKPAQSGADEYSEEGVPLGTGEDEEQEPVDDGEESDPAPSAPSGSTPAPTSSGTVGETAATPTGEQLPRTGMETWPIALIAIALLAAGTALRRRGLAAPRA
jgi:LPXTG-motif cell wall-anchored protein